MSSFGLEKGAGRRRVLWMCRKVSRSPSAGWPAPLGPFPCLCSPAGPSAAESQGGTPHSSGAFLPTQNSCGLACALEKGEAECKANLLAGSSFPCRVAAALASHRHRFCFRPVSEAAPGSACRMRSGWGWRCGVRAWGRAKASLVTDTTRVTGFGFFWKSRYDALEAVIKFLIPHPTPHGSCATDRFCTATGSGAKVKAGVQDDTLCFWLYKA